MPADITSDAVGRAGDTLGELGLTSSQKTVAFTFETGTRPTNRLIQLFSDQDWLFSSHSGTKFVPVKATRVWEVELCYEAVTNYYAKVPSGTATLYLAISK